MYSTLIESHNVAEMEKRNAEMQNLEKMRQLRENADRSMRQYPGFISKCKTYFIIEGMMYTIDKSMKDSNIDYDRNVCRNILEGYIKEKNPDLLLKEMEEKTLYLSSMAKAINEAVESVAEGCNKADNNTFTIKNSVNTEFFDKMNMMTDDQLNKTIHNSVVKATQDYVEGVIKDKENMKETSEKIKAKVDSLKTDNQDLKESYYRHYEYKIKENRKERPKNLLESIIINISEKAHKDAVVKESFIVAGKTDLDKVEKVATSVYVTLEAMNTTQLQVMDKAIFTKVVNSFR